MKKSIAFAMVIAALVLSACGGGTTPTQAPPPAQPTTAPAQPTAASAGQPTSAPTGELAPAVIPTAVPGLSGKMSMAGSSAMLPVMQLAATNFQKANKDVQMSVTAGGSGSGRSQVCKGQIDIGNSDVPLKSQEVTDLNCADAVQQPVVIQAFGPVANKKGPGSVTNLTKAQLQGIFSCTVTNWKDLGGDDQGIVVINRAKGSGTRANMANYLYGGDDTKFCTGASEEDNSETVLQTVKQTPGAVSYLGFAYLNNPDIIAFSLDGVAPTRADIQNGTWPVQSFGYSITKGQPNELEGAFLAYTLSPGFQNSKEFADLGFVPVPPGTQPVPAK